NGQQQAIGIGDDVPLAAIDTFARVKAARPAGLRRRSALAVDNRSAWFRLTSELPPCLFDQSSDNPVPPAGIGPGIEIALHRRVWRELAWQGAPLAAGGQNEQNCLHNLAQINCPRPTQSTPSRKPARDQLPLRICHIACIAESVTQILGASDFSPWHRALPRIFANPMESQPAEITHPFFGQALRMRQRVVLRRRRASVPNPKFASWC